ncbi:MAG TPA: DUF3175 domain-containing protein [Vicinamibacteria bacterium]|nr:DUF3175 domain-containing protein [Vicinamibacteria bacterium]
MKTRTRKGAAGHGAGNGRRWSAQVTRQSNALDLEPAVFKQRSGRAIAASLKRSAERSRRRKSGSYQSAMSMLSFYVNRAGRSLRPSERARLESARRELRRLFGRPAVSARAHGRRAR